MCQNNICAPVVSCAGQPPTCQGNMLMTCLADGKTKSGTVCPYGCEGTACLPAPTPTPFPLSLDPASLTYTPPTTDFLTQTPGITGGTTTAGGTYVFCGEDPACLAAYQGRTCQTQEQCTQLNTDLLKLTGGLFAGSLAAPLAVAAAPAVGTGIASVSNAANYAVIYTQAALQTAPTWVQAGVTYGTAGLSALNIYQAGQACQRDPSSIDCAAAMSGGFLMGQFSDDLSSIMSASQRAAQSTGILTTREAIDGTLFAQGALTPSTLKTQAGEYVSNGGERLILDPKKNPVFSQFLDNSQQVVGRGATDVEKAQLAMDYVAAQFPKYNRTTPRAVSDNTVKLHDAIYDSQNHVANIDQFITSGTAVCREQACMLEAVLASSGVSSQVARGSLKGGGHAWVEFVDPGSGSTMVADSVWGMVKNQSSAYSTYGGVKNVQYRTFFTPQTNVGVMSRVQNSLSNIFGQPQQQPIIAGAYLPPTPKPVVKVEANGWQDLMQKIDQNGGVQGSSRYYTAEELKQIVIDVRSGVKEPSAITRENGLRDSVEKLVKQDQAFNNLYSDIRSSGGVQGSSKYYSPNEVIDLIEQVRNGKRSIDSITRNNGLRDQVQSLLKQ